MGFHQQLTSLFQNFSLIVVLSDQLIQPKFNPTALTVLQLALLLCDGKVFYHHMINTIPTSRTAVFFEGAREKAKAFNAVPDKKISSNN